MNNYNFDYPVLTEEEALANKGFPTLDDGVYEFKVIEAKTGTSQAGNAKIDLVLSIIHEGQEFKVWDTLPATKNMVWKLKHFAETTGLKEFYEQKRFNHNICLHKSGEVLIGFQPERPNPNGGIYKSRNIVDDYCGETYEEENKGKFIDSAIPF